MVSVSVFVSFQSSQVVSGLVSISSFHLLRIIWIRYLMAICENVSLHILVVVLCVVPLTQVVMMMDVFKIIHVFD